MRKDRMIVFLLRRRYLLMALALAAAAGMFLAACPRSMGTACFRPDGLQWKRKTNNPRNHKGVLNRRFKRVFAYFCRVAIDFPCLRGHSMWPSQNRCFFSLARKEGPAAGEAAKVK